MYNYARRRHRALGQGIRLAIAWSKTVSHPYSGPIRFIDLQQFRWKRRMKQIQKKRV